MNKMKIAQNISKYFFNPLIRRSYGLYHSKPYHNLIVNQLNRNPLLTSRIVYFNSNDKPKPKDPKDQGPNWK